jgi:allantoin racemase
VDPSARREKKMNMRIRIIRPAAREFRPLTPAELEEHHKEWQRYASPGTEIEEVRVLKGAQTIESIYDADMSAPFVLDLVEQAQEDGVDGVIIHCMVDPALLAARELVDIPVMSTGLACFVTAVALGDKFSVIAPAGGSQMLVRSRLRVYSLEQHLASVREINIPVIDLRNNLHVLKQAMLEEGKRAVEEDGAELIVPGCGEIYGIAQELTNELGVPVLDPRATVLKFSEMLVEMSLSHSKKTYPIPPEKRREI